MNLRPKRRPVPAIPIISLIDIMVILLIFTTATTTFKKQRTEMKIVLPDSVAMGTTTATPSTRQTLTVDANQQLFLDGNPVALEALAPRLQAMKKADSTLKLELEADTQTELGVLVKIWDALKSAGIAVTDVPARIQRKGSP
jgi:biopolymer transport protein ExbD